MLDFFFKPKTFIWRWGYDSVVKFIYCSFGGPRSDSKHPQGSLELPALFPTPDYPMPFSDFHGLPHVCNEFTHI